MKFVLGVLGCWLIGSGAVLAYEIAQTLTEKPYEVVPIEVDEYNQVMHLGSLEGFPVMYEFGSDEPLELSLRLMTVVGQIPDDQKLSLMVVRENDDGSGVTEITRQVGKEMNWSTEKDSVYGLTFLNGEALHLDFKPGVYRIEVSTPVNEGAYMLAVGSTSQSVGYFKTLGQVRTVQKHFGYSVVRMLGSSYVYYSLGTLILLFIIHRTRKLRNKITNVT